MTPLLLDHLIVLLVQLAPTHKREEEKKKTSWTFIKNDQIKLLHLHKQNFWLSSVCPTPQINCPSKSYNAIQMITMGKSQAQTGSILNSVNNSGPFLGRLLPFILDCQSLPDGSIGRPVKLSFLL